MANEGQAAIISEDQHKQMLDYLAKGRHSSRNKAIYLLGYRAGLRVGSIAGLTLKDVLSEDGSIKTRVVARRAIMKGSKTSTFYLNHPELQEALVEWISERPKSSRVDNLFVSQKGFAFAPNVLSHTIQKWFKKVGLEDCSSHSLRRSMATNVIKSGADIVALKTLLNHSNIQTTQRYVTHNDDYLMDVVGNL
jgi:integrase/recombinase XerD